MRQNYNSFKFWDGKINEHKTIRGHMFMEKPPKDKSIFVHTLVFSKCNGIDNVYSYFPDEKVLLGYIQYSFLQQAFYNWIYGQDELISSYPSISVNEIIKKGLSENKISSSESETMRKHYSRIEGMWNLSKDKIKAELIKFSREFNKTWSGNNKKFLYLKIFRNIKEVEEFVINSAFAISSDDEFKNKVGVTIAEWRLICRNALKNEDAGNELRKILRKNLSEII